MITFKQFLAEAANYPLYHGTDVSRLKNIIRDNKMVAMYSDAHSEHPFAFKDTISMTRSKKFAFYWGKRINWASSYVDKYPADGVVIQFDREKLSRNHRILPYNHFPHEGARPNKWLGNPMRRGQEYKSIDSNQYEERIAAPIRDVNKYITKIFISEDSLEKFKADSPDEYKVIKSKIQVQ